MSEENRDYEQPEQKDAPETNGWNGASDGDYSYKQEDPAQRRETPEQNSWQSGRSEWNFNSYDDFEKKDGTQSNQESFGATGSSSGASGGFGGYSGDWPPKKPKKSSGAKVFAGILCGIIALSLICFAGYGVWMMLSSDYMVPGESESSAVSQPESSVPEQSGIDVPQQSSAETGIAIDRGHSGITIVDRPFGEETGEVELPWTVEVADKVGPTVVGIEIFSSESDYASDDNSEPSPDSSGSGIIMSPDGYIVTNAHVVAGAYKIRVTLSTGKTYTAALVGSDTITDLAVIRIDAAGLPYAEFGNSDQMKVGEFVLAIGNPGGMSLQGSVTYGMVSAVNREIRTSNSTLVCIQTDAAINPGNSGGALVNQYGQIVGINSAKIALEGYEGIGFAIASNHAQPVIDELIKYGRVTGRIQLGITAKLINSTYAMQNGVRPGMYIVEIKNQDIIDGGAQVGDIITHIDGVEVESFNGVSEQLAKYKEGDKVTLTIYRPATETTMAKTFDIEIRLIQDKAE